MHNTITDCNTGIKYRGVVIWNLILRDTNTDVCEAITDLGNTCIKYRGAVIWNLISRDDTNTDVCEAITDLCNIQVSKFRGAVIW